MQLFIVVLIVIAIAAVLAHVFKANFRLWDAPMNSVSMWWSMKNLRRCEIGWSDLSDKRNNHSFWWAIGGFSGTVLLQTWPWSGDKANK